MNTFRNFLVSLILSLLVFSCKNELPILSDYSAYEYAGTDANGGTWKPILLTIPDQIAIPVPDAINSAAYQAELAEVVTATQSLTKTQGEAVAYWTNNPTLRWNEISLEMAAKYNLIPGPNADGTYTLPDPANPNNKPYFPFAHPAYTCRALAYLSVAQFDGLIASWHYKYTFNRPAPKLSNASVNASYASNNLPTYPSDGAVIAVISRDILTAMFPLEKEFLDQKAAEHLASLKWAGENVESDITAGTTIGVEMAKIALARASSDGMKKAQTPKPVSDSIKGAAFDRFGWQWDNLETPVRPVGLAPLFGNVRLWNVPNVETVRPGPPPAIGSPEFQKDADELIDIADHLTLEQRKIANWWQDGLGSYTPPGHWNRFAKEYIIEAKMNPLRTARVFAYLNMAIMDGGISCWDTKYFYHYPRPIQTIPGFKTIMGTPNFPSYTSGHSVFSSSAAEVLSYFFPNDASQFTKWAEEAAMSRVYGGIHYRFDAEVGLAQGRDVAKYTVEVARLDGAD